MTLSIITNGYSSPDSTYFRVEAAQPELEADPMDGWKLKLVSGEGTRRSWGAPGVTSTVILNTARLVAVHVGFHHKHGGGQFYRYYRDNGQAWQQVEWRQLNDAERVQVLDAYESQAPSWAKIPGKVRASYAKPATTVKTTYKIVEVVDGRYFSVFDPKTEYTMGKRLAQRALDEHGGGYYSYPSVEGLLERFNSGALFPKRFYSEPMELALIEVEISGKIIDYGGSKYASTYIKPVREIERFDYTPKAQKAS